MEGFLGIDAGTQGLSVVFTTEDLKVVATGEADYEMLPTDVQGNYEQSPVDWETALVNAMADLRARSEEEMDVLAIGISGQMHGEVMADENGECFPSARLWCDARNEAEGDELTALLGTKMPKRITSARWLWTTRNQSNDAKRAKKMTTPAGWLAFRLTGEWNLGIGDASGMFPIDQNTKDYHQGMLAQVESLIDKDLPKLSSLLPTVKLAGEDGGSLNEQGAKLLGLQVGIPVAPAEGDQPAALAGSLIGDSGMVSVSFGTSVCANSVGDHAFEGVSSAVDHFCAVDGKPINMVWLRNGTTFMNSVVRMFSSAISEDADAGFAAVMPKVLEAPSDCDGLLALPFMDDEPGLGVSRGGTAMLVGLNESNATPGNAVKAALLASIFNLRLGSEVLDAQNFPRVELILTGGLAKTPETGQILADVFNTAVSLPQSADEGTAWGAALLAKYRFEVKNGREVPWGEFLNSNRQSPSQRFEPIEANAKAYDLVFERYKSLVDSQSALAMAISGE